MEDVFKIARAMAVYTADDKTRANQQKDWLAYVRELTTRLPAVKDLRHFRKYGFDINMLDIAEATPAGEDRNTHAPTAAREDLATILSLTAKGNAAIIV